MRWGPDPPKGRVRGENAICMANVWLKSKINSSSMVEIKLCRTVESSAFQLQETYVHHTLSFFNITVSVYELLECPSPSYSGTPSLNTPNTESYKIHRLHSAMNPFWDISYNYITYETKMVSVRFCELRMRCFVAGHVSTFAMKSPSFITVVVSASSSFLAEQCLLWLPKCQPPSLFISRVFK